MEGAGRPRSAPQTEQGELCSLFTDGQLVDRDRGQGRFGIRREFHVIKAHQRDVARDGKPAKLQSAQDLQGEEIVGAKNRVWQLRLHNLIHGRRSEVIIPDAALGKADAPPAAWYPDGAEVKVTATPSPAWTFDAWLGTSTDATNPLALTMDADKSLSARFLAPYDIWLKGHFTAQEIADSIITTPGADPDFDGMANLLESAAGLDPRARDTAGTPAADVSGGWFTLTYRRDASRTDITCQVESSGDLGQPGWLPISDEYVGNEGGFEWRRASVPLSEGRKFLRLRVRRLF